MFSDPQKNIEQLDLEKSAKVADFGAGSGFYTIALSRAVGGEGRVYAVDIQKDLLEKIKNTAKLEGLHNIEYVWGDLERLGGSKIQENSLDAVVIANILFQVENREVFVTEAKRVIKPNGRILVIDWADSFSGMGPEASRVITKAQAQKLFTDKGLKLVREIEAGSHHYGFIFSK
ncbi:MAG: methyltransferase domain-containing protein [Candidatus Paceibacterota bacterium]|jgi:ubiquinone/menaquinone biosynthesis C-methylase UbiE